MGYTFGRIGNFINGELYGRSTTVPWGMYFPLDSSHILRHPSQLYEALFEGVMLFILLWIIRKRSPFDGFLFSVYLAGYGAVRFLIEFFREPDPQIGYLFSFLTMGQVLCIIMVMLEAAVYGYRARHGAGRKILPDETPFAVLKKTTSQTISRKTVARMKK